MTPDHGKLFVISAPTGAGKTTLVKEALLRLTPHHNIKKVITYTTRPMRPGEVDGKDYHFISKEAFAKKKSEHFFLETTSYDHHEYGSPRSILDNLATGKSYIAITDRPGAHIIKQMYPAAVLIWIEVPDLDTVRARLHRREGDNESVIERRLQIAQQEMDAELKDPHFDYHIMNENFGQAVLELVGVMKEKLP